MFFSINRNFNDDRFSMHNTIGDFVISLDNGWQSKNFGDAAIFYKGYCDSDLLDNIVEEFVDDTTPRYTGNFCVIVATTDAVTVTHDFNRAFPLKFYNQTILTNLPALDNELGTCEDIWADCWVSYKKNKDLDRNYYNCFYWDQFEFDLSVDQCKHKIQQVLDEKIAGLGQFKKPVRVFLSGGIDTTFVYSILKYCLDINDIKIVVDEIFENTEFSITNHENILHNKSLWGYRQFHNWRLPTVYATGGMGDEIFMRGPVAAAMICAWYNIDLMQKFDKVEYCYHKKYFEKEKNQKIVQYYWQNRHELQEKYPTYTDMCKEIVNIIANDHQHWHFENTVSWTPFKDLRILNAVLGLNKKDLLKQIMTGFIDKQIIDELSPGMSQYICTNKNINQYNNLINYQSWRTLINAGM